MLVSFQDECRCAVLPSFRLIGLRCHNYNHSIHFWYLVECSIVLIEITWENVTVFGTHWSVVSNLSHYYYIYLLCRDMKLEGEWTHQYWEEFSNRISAYDSGRCVGFRKRLILPLDWRSAFRRLDGCIPPTAFPNHETTAHSHCLVSYWSESAILCCWLRTAYN